MVHKVESPTEPGCPIHAEASSRHGWAFAKRTAPAGPPPHPKIVILSEAQRSRRTRHTAGTTQPLEPFNHNSPSAVAGSPTHLTRRTFIAALPLAPHALTQPTPNDPTFTVLSLFHPKTLILHATTTDLPLLLNNQPITLPRNQSLTINTPTTVRIPTPTTFTLEVPHKLRRTYTGTLLIEPDSDHLRAIIAIDLELAVASIVAAESPPHATANALAAQAIASRSFLLGATTSHTHAAFCDTTHCQYLREPPPPNSPFTLAAARTAGLVLQFRDPTGPHTLAAMYSRSCGGRTRTLAELGLPARAYPYYAVDCAFCRLHPELWQRDTASTPNTEPARLDYNRIHGWSALPGHADITTPLLVSGRGIGHGLGLCQLGSAALSSSGATFAEILTHYYPNTTLTHSS